MLIELFFDRAAVDADNARALVAAAYEKLGRGMGDQGVETLRDAWYCPLREKDGFDPAQLKGALAEVLAERGLVIGGDAPHPRSMQYKVGAPS